MNSKDLPPDQLLMIVDAKQTDSPIFLSILMKVNEKSVLSDSYEKGGIAYRKNFFS